VLTWLEDDPYPRADVADWPDEDAAIVSVDRVVEVGAHVRRVLALSAELGDATPAVTTEISDDPVLASYHLSALCPLGPLDRLALLAAPGPRARVELLEHLLDDIDEVLRFRLGGGRDRPGG
jgi:Lon protease-like protein